MNKRKVSSKQEREALILSFLSSGQTKTLWCKENNISQIGLSGEYVKSFLP